MRENQVAPTYDTEGSYDEVTYCTVCHTELSRITRTAAKLVRKNVSSLTVTLGTASYTYDGTAKKPAVTVKDGTKTLKAGTDYSVSYKNNTNAGTASAVITGKGAYTGTKTVTFTIAKAAQTITVTAANTSVTAGKTTTVTTAGAKGTVTYASSDTTVAAVDRTTGKVTAKKAGTVKITATAAATGNYRQASASVTIKVTAAKKFPFTDVVKTDDYYDAVAWAYFAGIVKGKSETLFAPNDSLTRGEFCTMLWRMFGKPSVDGLTCPFPDASKSNHYKAILWCYNQGIINGYPAKDGGAPMFKPSRTITRGNILVMLFKLAKKEPGYTPTSIKNPFTDVKDGNGSLPAYKWAYANKVTTDRTLRPTADCTRATMVSYLYGYNNNYHIKD